MSSLSVFLYACPLVTSPSRKGLGSSHGFRRSTAPLKFPDLDEYSEGRKPQLQFTGPQDQSLTKPTIQYSSPTTPPPNSDDRMSTSELYISPEAGREPEGNQLNNKGEVNLPPIPNRLVPSRSTEQIMALLTQQGLATSYDKPKEQTGMQQLAAERGGGNQRSSTPARAKARSRVSSAAVI